MKKKYLLIIIIMFILSGCNTPGQINSSSQGDKPPNAYIEIDGERFDTKLGTYCWKSLGYAECVDTAGPKQLLMDEDPIQVEAGATVMFGMDYKPMPNKVHLTQSSKDGEMDVTVTDHTFTAPDEEGLYYYYYGVWWENGNVSDGDAFYAFALEVK
ncbi:lipoprotein [Ornithinibacillus californiensis]|uniref:lipoprotein n=1 Tax=Ornithinibacillus californiensis TaxID=161536 RepID=UPI00064DAC9C|nr:lipoprotein [Ornithinibacillus californiensis]